MKHILSACADSDGVTLTYSDGTNTHQPHNQRKTNGHLNSVLDSRDRRGNRNNGTRCSTNVDHRRQSEERL